MRHSRYQEGENGGGGGCLVGAGMVHALRDFFPTIPVYNKQNSMKCDACPACVEWRMWPARGWLAVLQC
jgi:hypothetical protein